MPFSYQGVCYATPEAAMSAFALSFPKADGDSVSSLTQFPSTNNNGLVSYSLNTTTFSTGVTNSYNGSIQLLSCELPLMDQFPVQSILMIAGLFFAFIKGFSTGYRP